MTKQNWQDVYYDALIDPSKEYFCEESQRNYKNEMNDGWDSIEELSSYKSFIMDESDDYELELMRGNIKRENKV